MLMLSCGIDRNTYRLQHVRFVRAPTDGELDLKRKCYSKIGHVTGIIALLCAVPLSCFGSSKLPDRLRSPWDDTKISLTDAQYNCPMPPAFTRTIDAEGYYVDDHHSVIDPVKKAAYEQIEKALSGFGNDVSSAADNYLTTGSRAAAVCVYSLLDTAARADAWAGKMPHNQGVYDQNWMLSGTAIPYLKVRDSGVGTSQQDTEIQKWFLLGATQVRAYFDEKHFHPNSDAWNNHIYWAGLSVAAQGIAGNDKGAFKWGMAAYAMGMDAIEPDGSLPLEMNRAGMALHYQFYAVAPLVILAELGEANGIDMYGQKRDAIHRLVNFDVAALQDPSIIAKQTGVTQNFPAKISGPEIGWAVPYVRRFPNAQLSAWISQASTTRFWQWGGLPPE
jgi:poly(beta-D-mannuronate) lyase